MNKKGFTLVELLASIIILAVIAVIVTPIIWGTISSSKEKAYEHQLEELYKAVDVYVTDNTIELDPGDYMYVSVGELFAEDYLTTIPKSSIDNKIMDGLLKITGTMTSNQYEYIEKNDISDDSVLVLFDSNGAISIPGVTEVEPSNLFKILAEKVKGKGDSEVRKIDGKDALIVNSADIKQVKTEWFVDTLVPNTSYTLTIQSRPITGVEVDQKYQMNLEFIKQDGTKTAPCAIASSSDTQFTTYTCSVSDVDQIRGMSFSATENSQLLFAFLIDSFTVTPNVIQAPNYPMKISSLAENRYLNIKMVTSDGTYRKNRVGLTSALRKIEGSNTQDTLRIKADGSLEVEYKVGKVTLDRNNVNTSNVTLTSNGSSYTHHAFTITGVLYQHLSSNSDVMSDTFEAVSNLTSDATDRAGIALDGNNVVIKVLKSEFPTVDSFIRFIETNPVDVYYTLNAPVVETPSGGPVNLSDVSYLYIESDFHPKITRN